MQADRTFIKNEQYMLVHEYPLSGASNMGQQGKVGETSTNKDGTSLEWLNILLLLMIVIY